MSLDFRIYNRETVYDSNITHNLTVMADKAGVYKALWRPKENNFIYAKDIIEILEKGIEDLKARPEYFEQFNAENGWGMYEHFVPFVEEVLLACKQNPDSYIEASV